jgi:hypothetical protein
MADKKEIRASLAATRKNFFSLVKQNRVAKSMDVIT